MEARSDGSIAKETKTDLNCKDYLIKINCFPMFSELMNIP